jgi:hypothetical protein
VTRFALGVQGALGLEWFLGEHVSLIGELGVNAEKRWYLFRVEYRDDYGYHWSEADVFDGDAVIDSPRLNLGIAGHF